MRNPVETIPPDLVPERELPMDCIEPRPLGDDAMEPRIEYGYRRNRCPQPPAPGSNNGNRAGIVERRKVFQFLYRGDDLLINAHRIGITLAAVDYAIRSDVEISRASDSENSSCPTPSRKGPPRRHVRVPALTPPPAA